MIGIWTNPFFNKKYLGPFYESEEGYIDASLNIKPDTNYSITETRFVVEMRLKNEKYQPVYNNIKHRTFANKKLELELLVSIKIAN